MYSETGLKHDHYVSSQWPLEQHVYEAPLMQLDFALKAWQSYFLFSGPDLIFSPCHLNVLKNRISVVGENAHPIVLP